jgi:hypothetical protein
VAGAAKSYTHSVGEFDPVRKAMAGHGDHYRNIGAQRTLYQIGKAPTTPLERLGAWPANQFEGAEASRIVPAIHAEATDTMAATMLL